MCNSSSLHRTFTPEICAKCCSATEQKKKEEQRDRMMKVDFVRKLVHFQFATIQKRE